MAKKIKVTVIRPTKPLLLKRKINLIRNTQNWMMLKRILGLTLKCIKVWKHFCHKRIVTGM